MKEENIEKYGLILGAILSGFFILLALVASFGSIWVIVEFLIYLAKDKPFNWLSIWVTGSAWFGVGLSKLWAFLESEEFKSLFGKIKRNKKIKKKKEKQNNYLKLRAELYELQLKVGYMEAVLIKPRKKPDFNTGELVFIEKSGRFGERYYTLKATVIDIIYPDNPYSEDYKYRILFVNGDENVVDSDDISKANID